MSSPEVSVVMSVYNGAKYLRESVESILSQKGVDFEFIIVNDGSTDASGNILDEYAAQDKRIRIIEQKNIGLTHSMIRACNEARGTYIARQDADDVSFQGRLKKQLDYLKNHEEVTLVSCYTIFTGPKGEELYRVERNDSSEEATSKLRLPNVNKIQGINGHGSAMFRKKDYIRAGGYREQFYFAQDLDLWLRLTDFGLLSFVPEFLYEVKLSASDISAKYTDKQVELAGISIELSNIRQQGGDETKLLKQAATIKPNLKDRSSHNSVKGLYFIGKCLLDRGDRRGIYYLSRAFRINPFHLKSWLALFKGIHRSK